MNKLRRTALAQTALLLAGVMLCALSASAQGWWVGRNQGPNLSAVYAISPEDGRGLEHVWVGDEAGNFGIINNPEENVFSLSMTTVGPPPPKPTRRAPAQPPLPINDIYFLDPGYGFVLKGNAIYTNRGGIWSPFMVVPPAPDGSTATLYSLNFFPNHKDKRGCVVGVYSRKEVVTRNLVLCGSLQGNTSMANWTSPLLVDQTAEQSQVELFHLALVDDKHGWIVGSDGTILYTTDSGDTWRRQDSKTKASLFHANFVSPKEGVVVGEYGTILRTENGKDWQPITHPNNPLLAGGEVSLVSVKFAGKDKGWAVGRKGVILYTESGGEKWKDVSLPDRREDLFALFIDGRYCWAVGAKGLILRYDLQK